MRSKSPLPLLQRFTMAIRSHLAPLVLLLPTVLAAANNWDVPCFDGKCAYDVVSRGPHGTTTGSLFIVRASLLLHLDVFC